MLKYTGMKKSVKIKAISCVFYFSKSFGQIFYLYFSEESSEIIINSVFIKVVMIILLAIITHR